MTDYRFDLLPDIARLVAADVHWMMQRMDIPGVVYDQDETRQPTTRYGRLLVRMANVALDELGAE